MAASAGSSKKRKTNAPAADDDEPFDARGVLARALALCDSPEARPPTKP